MSNSPAPGPWYQGVTRYQWLVLAIASAGWVFDVFEGQIFVSVKDDMLAALVTDEDIAARYAHDDSLIGRTARMQERAAAAREFLFNLSLAAFLAGGALGGIIFGMMADRWGRTRTMALTIIMYSAFTGLTALTQAGWQMVLLRFFVGMGVGGEWAVAAAAVAEVFPPRARAGASGLFHASSVLGTFLAVGAGFLVLPYEQGWRIGFLIGVLPALLVAWIRVSMHEPESWQAAKEKAQQDPSKRMGRFTDLFSTPLVRKHTLIGTSLAVIGLATFWGTHIRGRDLLINAVREEQAALPTELRDAQAPARYGLYGMFLATTGGGIGLLSFAPISQRIGRRPAFALFHIGGFGMVAALTMTALSSVNLMILLPIFGFFTLGMHAGYAVYFPELFPTRLRGTGTGFCFNAARILAGPVLLGFVYLRNPPLNLGLNGAMFVLGCLFLIGLVVLWFAPETKGKPLPD